MALDWEAWCIVSARSPLLGLKAIPFDQYEYVEVEFLNPAEYQKVYHNLKVTDPYSVRYIPVSKSGDGTISDNRNDTSNGIAWGRNYIVLRCNLAPMVAELLLTVRKEQ